MLPILIALGQLFDTYFRWLPFSEHETEESKRKLFLCLAIWSVASFFVYKFLFAHFGINAVTYKPIWMLGWLPYFLICLNFLGGKLPQHIFVLGMGAIFSLSQHTVASSIDLFLFSEPSDIIFFEATFYLLLFAISYPLFKKFFVRLLPSQEFFDLRPPGIYLALLPLLIVSAHIFRIAADVLITLGRSDFRDFICRRCFSFSINTSCPPRKIFTTCKSWSAINFCWRSGWRRCASTTIGFKRIRRKFLSCATTCATATT